MECYLVEFACTKDDPVRHFLLDDKKMDDWSLADGGTEGYHVFRTIWHGNIDGVFTALNDFRDICCHTPR